MTLSLSVRAYVVYTTLPDEATPKLHILQLRTRLAPTSNWIHEEEYDRLGPKYRYIILVNSRHSGAYNRRPVWVGYNMVTKDGRNSQLKSQHSPQFRYK